MAQVVMALDFSAADNYKFDEQVNQWFINNNAIVNEESYTLGKDLLKFNNYSDFNVVIFNFDNLNGDYFSALFYNYLNSLDSTNQIKISLAEEGPFGFETLVETTLNKFLQMLQDDDGEE
jgi:hypothetical protein|tara:strand:- start:2830 stop:3189 length:360 start_codon:yes stop_codon:yes gene_type:complete